MKNGRAHNYGARRCRGKACLAMLQKERFEKSRPAPPLQNAKTLARCRRAGRHLCSFLMANLSSRQIPVGDGVSIHCYEQPGAGTPLMLLHSLSANGRIFDRILQSGLLPGHRILVPDLRGRGESSRPATGYSLRHQATDLLRVLDSLGIDRIALGGHSFGGLLSLYLAGTHPDRVSKLILMDAAVELNPLTPMMLLAMTVRLGVIHPSWEAYVAGMRAAPFMTRWDDAILSYMRADALTMPGGAVISKSRPEHVAQISAAVYAMQKRDWTALASKVRCPSLVLRAEEPFVSGQYIVEPDKAVETTVLLHDSDLEVIPGNHITMLYGEGAARIAREVTRFVKAGVRQAATL